MECSDIRISLSYAAEPNYADFQRKIVSDTAYPIAGVRMPALRKLAKQIALGNWHPALLTSHFESYEEVMLCGLVIAYAPVCLEQKLQLLRRYLPFVDSWALTDSIAPTLRIAREERGMLWSFAEACIADAHEYTVRFGIVLMLHFFLSEENIPQVVRLLTAIRDKRYYVQMAVAWCLAEAAVHNFPIVEDILRRNCLDSFTHRKTIQKMRESYRITKEQKEILALLRRK